ncbi:MAG: putative bifunctional diguanylate cyclase/phosphodiesterase, partial [Burkholderiaceae bacterium]
MQPRYDPALLLDAIYRSATDFAITTFDMDGKVTSWNSGAERIIGYAAEEILGQDAACIFTEEDRRQRAPQTEMEVARTNGRSADYRWHLRKDGSCFWADGVMTPIRDAAGKPLGYLKIMRDVTSRKTAEDKIHQLANFDRLTGLANRLAFDARLADAVALAVRTGEPFVLQLLDLDGFKQVNDALGHHGGDMLLQQVAQRLRDVLEPEHLVARLGGDEFAFMQPPSPTPEPAEEFAGRVLAALTQPFVIDGRRVAISGSIGLAVCPQDADEPDLLLRKADLALYRAKSEGRNRLHFFTEHLDAVAHRRSRHLAELREAVATKAFSPHYQPIVDCADRRTVGMEVLLRCENPALSRLSTEELVRLAVESGVMPDISAWLMRQACAQFAAWRREEIGPPRISFNLCSLELIDPGTAAMIDGILAATGVAPHELDLEITERQALEIGQHGLDTLHRLRSRGISLSLDDFGTGFSALSYLTNLPVTAIKLDRSFLDGLPGKTQGSVVVTSVIS